MDFPTDQMVTMAKFPTLRAQILQQNSYLQQRNGNHQKQSFSSPDAAQTPVRYLALKDNKNLIMASPNLTHGYLFLEGQNIKEIEEASTKEGAFKHCSKKDISNIRVDLVVEGSVGVDRMGHRIGKGKGFADREIEDLKKRNIITNSTAIATTIHPLQLLNHIPTESHDQRINMIVTTREIIRI